MSSGALSGVAVEQFRFIDCSYDRLTGEARLAYAFDHGEPLVERIVFPHAPWPADASRQAAFERALGLLHLVAGVSYYKACVPGRMDAGQHRVNAGLAGFLKHLYVDGLAEFAFVNEIELAGRVNFPVSNVGAAGPFELDLPGRALLAMGGGKDSLVSLDLLRAAGIEFQPVCVGASALIAQTVRAAGLPLLAIQRELAPGLARMNAAGALNGHVPVTAINSAILLCAALLYGFAWVVFSNERSAEEATRVDALGRAVNHQYSKSLVFERALRQVVHAHISPGLDYFSLLRPLTELGVAARFSRLREFHPVFSSCNRNFHQAGSRLGDARWCGDCPKCRFTSLALAPFLSPAEVVGFMGFDLLDQPAQEAGFRALCELGEDKPFECVGSVSECRAALRELGGQAGWRDRWIVRELGPELAGMEVPDLATLLAPAGDHCIPPEVLRRVAF